MPFRYDGTTVFVGLPRYLHQKGGGGDGGNSSTGPALKNSKTTLAVPKPGDNVDASKPACPLNSRIEEVSKNYRQQRGLRGKIPWQRCLVTT
jgi:hypothetical protein